MNVATDGAVMPKVQKTFLIPEELAIVIDKVIELSGANFTKIATAALLQYIFDAGRHPEDGGRFVGPVAPEWMSFAIRLERGDITLGNIPSDTLKDAAFLAEHMLRGGKQDWTDYWKKIRGARHDALIRWKAAMDQHKDEVPAILGLIEECFGKK